MNRYKYILLSLPVVLTVMLVGCTKELISDEPLNESNTAILSIKTRTGIHDDLGLENERAVKTLRMIVFNSVGNQVANTLYDSEQLKNDFAGNGSYTIVQRLPHNLGEITVSLIANEPASWSLGSGISYAALKNIYIRYNHDLDFINNNYNSNDLNLYTSPDDYFLMYAQTTVNFVAGNVYIAEFLPLERTAAKVTLNLKYNRLLDVNYDGGETFVLKSASIQNQPVFSTLNLRQYNGVDLLPTSFQTLKVAGTTKSSRASSVTPTDATTVPLVFYIPEYYLSPEAFGAGLFTYIEVLAEYSTAGATMPITYKIPLGEGVQNIFGSGPGYTPKIEDYTIAGNHHYIINGTITKLGEKDGIQTKISIKEWQNGETVEVEAVAPYLNVSDISLHQQITLLQQEDVSHRIFFWSNQPQGSIEVEGVETALYNANAENIGKLDSVTGNNDKLSVVITKYNSEINGNFVENNGHIDINLSSDRITYDKLVVTFYVKAGNLKRKVVVTYSVT